MMNAMKLKALALIEARRLKNRDMGYMPRDYQALIGMLEIMVREAEREPQNGSGETEPSIYSTMFGKQKTVFQLTPEPAPKPKKAQRKREHRAARQSANADMRSYRGKI